MKQSFNYGNDGCDGFSPNFPLDPYKTESDRENIKLYGI